MSKAQHLRDVEIPDNFDEWDFAAKMNYLNGAMDRVQVANFVRDVHGLEERDQPTFRKDELVKIAAKRLEDHA